MVRFIHASRQSEKGRAGEWESNEQARTPISTLEFIEKLRFSLWKYCFY